MRRMIAVVSLYFSPGQVQAATKEHLFRVLRTSEGTCHPTAAVPTIAVPPERAGSPRVKPIPWLGGVLDFGGNTEPNG